VKRDLARAARLLVLPTVALGVVLAFAPGRVGLALRVYALVLCAVALVIMLAVLRRAFPRETPLRPRSRARSSVARDIPPALGRLEQETTLGSAWAFDLHHRLCPSLRELAGELLIARRGISVDDDPERARRALGEATWELVRPDRPRPADRQARGIPINDLRAVVESLENV
jgi:hypothetical protein